jgi:hypothetical protein
MTVSNMGSRSASADLPRKKPAANCGPMCQQSPLGAHGHDMHPQEFVRLVGSSDKGNKGKEKKVEKVERLHH